MDWYRLSETIGELVAIHAILWQYTASYRRWWREALEWLRRAPLPRVSARLRSEVTQILNASGWL